MKIFANKKKEVFSCTFKNSFTNKNHWYLDGSLILMMEAFFKINFSLKKKV
jgi:hypothetical protein